MVSEKTTDKTKKSVQEESKSTKENNKAQDLKPKDAKAVKPIDENEDLVKKIIK